MRLKSVGLSKDLTFAKGGAFVFFFQQIISVKSKVGKNYNKGI